jgi:hypothetical protein
MNFEKAILSCAKAAIFATIERYTKGHEGLGVRLRIEQMHVIDTLNHLVG